MKILGENNQGPRILVAGDSWAYVHGPKGASLTHSYSEMLANWGYHVTVVAECGMSNVHSIERITERLAKDKYDLVVWTQTGPTRDYRNRAGKVDASALLRTARIHENNIEQGLEHHLVYTVYPQLNNLAVSYNIPILCMGGCSKIVKRIGGYPGLTPLIYSIPELLIYNHTDSILHDCDHWTSGEYADLIADHQGLVQDWLKVTSQIKDKYNAWSECTSFFRPDITHPNHIGHCIIAAKIQDWLKLVRR